MTKQKRAIIANERGNAFITVALILPVMLTLILGASDLFLYFRTAAVVERAAAEAAKAASAAAAGNPSNYDNFTLPAVTGKKTIESKSGLWWNTTYTSSFADAGVFYQKPTGAPAAPTAPLVKNIPFNLETAPEYLAPGVYGQGVQYLPRVHISSTCMKPHTSGISWDWSSCSADVDLFYHHMPVDIDFDGDNRGDVAFYTRGQGGLVDWWVLPSGSGTYFSQALELNFGAGNGYYPCPADYDGDGRTDPCYYIALGGLIFASFKLSSTNLKQDVFLSHGGTGVDRVFAVPGRWDKTSNQDQFAIVITGTANYTDHLATWVYPKFVKSSGTGDNAVWTVSNLPTKYDDHKYKPLPGRHWRPAFGDHDGDGDVDIGWLTWDAGNPVTRIAGTGTAGNSASQSVADPWTATLAPWGLFSPAGGNKGLYVVERGNHRVSYISPASDSVVNGANRPAQLENYRVISGITHAGSLPAISTVDPHTPGEFDWSPPVPMAPGDDGCPACEAGGDFGGDGVAAYTANLNSPRDVWTEGGAGDNLYIADFGNYRVRAVVPTDGAVVDGVGTEEIRTIVGGEATIACPTASVPSPLPGSPSISWDKYDYNIRRIQGVHPRCVKLRPVSLAGIYLPGLSLDTLFIGDEQGAIFGYYTGPDGLINSDTDPADRLFILYSPTNAAPPNIYQVGDNNLYGNTPTYSVIPQAMHVRNDGGSVVLVVGSRIRETPFTTDTQMAMMTAFQTGIDQIFGTGDDILDNNLSFYQYPKTRNRPVIYNASATANYNLVNISDIYIVNTNNGSQVGYQGYVTDWFRNGTTPNAQLYGLYNIFFRSGSFLDKGLRWINNPHFGNWGSKRPTSRHSPYSTMDSTNFPISTTPVEPAGGIAVDEANGYLYFSETERGTIYTVFLDRDGDGSSDLVDTDLDGDGRNNTEEADGSLGILTDYTLPDTGYPDRQFHAYPDAKFFAVATTDGGMVLEGGDVDRVEWMIDKFLYPANVPGVDPVVPDTDEPPFMILNDYTSTAAIPRGALHGTPVFSGGPSLGNQPGGSGGPLLAPVIMAKPRPSKFHLKQVNAYDHCTDFSFDEFGAHSMTNKGVPSTVCGRTITNNIAGIGGGKTLKSGMRRAIMGQWNGQWHPYSSSNSGDYMNEGEGHLVFIDRDGDDAADPAIFNSQKASTRPFMVYFGNMQGTETGDYSGPLSCPGQYSQTDLQNLFYVFNAIYTPGANATTEPQNLCSTGAFFNPNASTKIQGVMADTHAEWWVTTKEMSTNLASMTSERFSLGTAGDLDLSQHIGPVAETAYTILESSLRVDSRESITAAHHARITFSAVSTKQNDITVEYVIPLNSILANLLGAQTHIVKKTIRANVFNFGNNA